MSLRGLWSSAIGGWVALWMGVAAVAGFASGAGAQQKDGLDNALTRSTTTAECMIVARRYQSLGMSADAKRAVDRCATMAKVGSEWHTIASSYQALGYQELADAARSKANHAPIR